MFVKSLIVIAFASLVAAKSTVMKTSGPMKEHTVITKADKAQKHHEKAATKAHKAGNIKKAVVHAKKVVHHMLKKAAAHKAIAKKLMKAGHHAAAKKEMKKAQTILERDSSLQNMAGSVAYTHYVGVIAQNINQLRN